MAYREMTVEASNVETLKIDKKPRVSFRVRVSASPTRAMMPDDALVVQYDRDSVNGMLTNLEDEKLSAEGVKAFGQALGLMLFPEGLPREILSENLNTLGADGALRIRLILPPLLASLPWEFIYVDRVEPAGDVDGFLALDPRVSIVRYEPHALANPPAPLEGEIKVVAAFAAAEDAPLDVEREQKIIERALARQPGVSFAALPDATLEEIQKAIPGAAVFHFAGHASGGDDVGTGAIQLNDQNVSAGDVKLNLRGNGIRLAVLAGCETGRRNTKFAWKDVATALINAEIPAVVANQLSISDECAIAFSKLFYNSLAAGLPLERAVSAGRLAAYNADREGRDWGVPVLYMGKDDLTLFAGSNDPAVRQQAAQSPEAEVKLRIRQVEKGGRVIAGELEQVLGGKLAFDVTVTETVGGKVQGAKVKTFRAGHLAVNMSVDTVGPGGVVHGIEIHTLGAGGDELELAKGKSSAGHAKQGGRTRRSEPPAEPSGRRVERGRRGTRRGQRAKPPPSPQSRPRPERFVNHGFAEMTSPYRELDTKTPLGAGRRYYFWLEVGKRLAESIATEPAPLSYDDVPADARLKVALFAFPGGIEIESGADVGELQLVPGMPSRVLVPPAGTPADASSSRLYFSVRAPQVSGDAQLRCNIYYQGILVQSHLITARVMSSPVRTEGALQTILDYALSHSLDQNELRASQAHRLSIMLNANGDGTHSLRFLGTDNQEFFKDDAVIPSAELEEPIAKARKELGRACWGDDRPWDNQAYRYADRTLDETRLKEDLGRLAITGYLLYDGIIDKLTTRRRESYKLLHLMRTHGLVQIALKQSPSTIIPAALFYDYPLDAKRRADLRLCEEFLSALHRPAPLENSVCFQGHCPHADEVNSLFVCPSGFWGYRHSVGMPISMPEDAPPAIPVQGALKMVVGAATNLELLTEHMRDLQALGPEWHYATRANDVVQAMKQVKSELIYFYCHGGLTADSIPYLQLGSGDDYLLGYELRARQILWEDPKPLVFINGCHTTAVEPTQALNLVQDFVNTGASGVIGTEVTIFESLATDFALECLRAFTPGSTTIGSAVRSARLKLLKEGNPLGLVYTPFVRADLCLQKAPSD